MKDLILVGCGGFLGSVGRYLVSGWMHHMAPLSTFPLGTLAVNVTGCLLIGLCGGLLESRQAFGPEVRLFLLIGVLGGFTTFSSFGHETMAMARDAQLWRAGLNVTLSVVCGLAAAWAGYAIIKS